MKKIKLALGVVMTVFIFGVVVVEVKASPGLEFSTYFGGSGEDGVKDLAIDDTGNIYLVGNTTSVNMSALNSYAGGRDAYIAKFTPNWQLVYYRYLGGVASDFARKVAVDGVGNAYITGATNSLSFPQTINGGVCGDTYKLGAFAAKISPDGSLLYSTCLGKDVYHNVASSSDVAVDNEGNAIYSGWSYVYGTAFDSADVYIAKLSSTGAVVYKQYLAGSKDEYGGAVATDTAGNAYIVGTTYSGDFYTLGAYQSSLKGARDAFIVKFSPAGSILYSTYFGGDGTWYDGGDGANDIAVNSFGNIYITGSTANSNFPTTADAYDGTWNAYGDDIFVSEFSPDGQSLVYSTFIGGNSNDIGGKIILGEDGSIYLSGITSSNADFPIVNAYRPEKAQSQDYFLLKLTSGGSLIEFSTYLGEIAPGALDAYGIAIGGEGDVYVASDTSRSDFPFISGIQSYLNGPSDGYIAVLGYGNQPPVANAGGDQAVILGESALFDGSGSTDLDGVADIVSYDWNFGDGTMAASGANVSHTYGQSGMYTVILTVTDAAGATSSDTLSMTVITPALATENLVVTVELLNLQQGIENSLDAKLNAAVGTLTDLNENNNQAAINSLQAFVNAVEAQRGDKITNE